MENRFIEVNRNYGRGKQEQTRGSVVWQEVPGDTGKATEMTEFAENRSHRKKQETTQAEVCMDWAQRIEKRWRSGHWRGGSERKVVSTSTVAEMVHVVNSWGEEGRRNRST